MTPSKPYGHHFQKMADTGTIRGVGRISPEEPKKADVESGSPVKFYTACIRSVLEYSCQVFHTSLPQYLSHEMEYNYGEESTQLQKATAKAKLGTLFEEEKLCIKSYLVRSRLQMSTRDTNFGTYYHLSLDHVNMNRGMKEFTHCH